MASSLRLPSLLTCLALAWLLFACGGESGSRGRVLLVGIDGATLRIATPMMRSGRLPNLASIAQQGIHGPLRAHFPLTSPRIWASIATGKNPANHGIKGFARTDEDGVKHLYQSTDRTAPALWNIVSHAGLSVGVVNWWTTYPVAVVRGAIVSDHLLAQELRGRRSVSGADVIHEGGPIVYPPDWGPRVAALLADESTLEGLPDPFAQAAGMPKWIDVEKLERRLRNDLAVTRVALEMEAELKPDLLCVFLPGIDRISHKLWAAIEPPEAYSKPPRFSDEQRAATRSVLEGYYEFTDALIGRLLEGLGPDDLVMVVSDHGFEAGRRMMVLTGIHNSGKALHGVIFARGPGVAQARVVEGTSVNDVTPTLLTWLGLPLGRDMEGQPAAFLEVSGPPPIDTHDAIPIERLPAGVAEAAAAEREILEHLKALGYFEDGESE